MDTVLDVSDRSVVPMFRSGVFVQFLPQKFTGATLILKTSSGESVPIGAEVRVDGVSQGLVAFHGEVFLPLLKVPAHLHVEWPSHICEVTVERLPSEVLPRIGPLLCMEGK
jgi:outer membrane usher protein FimD/PapC